MKIHCARRRGDEFVEAVRGGRFLFALVLSHTETSSIPGITAAGAAPGLVRLTPPADAEFIHYGQCLSTDSVPATPDGKPTPALITKAALESASIPHLAIDAGCASPPRLPHVWTGLSPGGNIRDGPAMSEAEAVRALDAGRTVGRMLAPLADCLVVGESVPGGTATALAVLRGLGHGSARVSSSMPQNPTELKEAVASAALSRAGRDPMDVAACAGDPMMLFVAGMLGTASGISRVMLAGGTQMAAILALAGRLGYDASRAAVASTRYVVEDGSANMVETVSRISDVPVLGADPGLAESGIPGLRAFAEGFAKEGAGAGGCVAAAHLRAGIGPDTIRGMAEAEYRRIFT